jgi:hypothetical protein
MKTYRAEHEILADYLSDHLWQRNSLDYDFLKTFPEFHYKGIGYRAHFLNNFSEPSDCSKKSFSKSKEGLKEFIYNSQTYDKDFVAGKTPYVFQAQIEGFDIQLAMTFFKEHGGLAESTINSFLDEEEVIAFSHTKLEQIEL